MEHVRRKVAPEGEIKDVRKKGYSRGEKEAWPALKRELEIWCKCKRSRENHAGQEDQQNVESDKEAGGTAEPNQMAGTLAAS